MAKAAAFERRDVEALIIKSSSLAK